MKRFHVHVSVAEIAPSVRFYTALFATEPTVSKPDYAKWMLDDPRVNFAISQRGGDPGLDHLGIQTESDAELIEMQQRLDRAALPTTAETNASCCYTKSDKYWSTDPQGIAWESFHTLDSIPTFGAPLAEQPTAACCVPADGKRAGACC